MQISKDTIFLFIGIFMVFVGVFGGGFQIKEIKMPKVNKISRIFGFAVGLVFILLSLNVFGSLLDSVNNAGGNLSQGDTTNVGSNNGSAMASDLPTKNSNESIKNQFVQLEEAWSDSKYGNTELLAEYEKIKNHETFNDLDFQIRSAINRRITDLSNSNEKMKSLKNMVQSDSVVVTQKYALLNEANFERLSQIDHSFVEKQKEYYQTMLSKSAYIKDWADFGTFRDVNKNTLNPIDRRENFNAGTVWVWARIHAPKNETLKLQWVDAKTKKVLKSVDVKVRKNVESGYRTYYSKSFSDRGAYEVMLLNHENQLIGRQRFTVS